MASILQHFSTDSDSDDEQPPEAGIPGGAAAPEELEPLRDWGADVAAVDNAALTQRDMVVLVHASIKSEGLVGHNLKEYNNLVEQGIDRIMTQLFAIDRVVRYERTQTERDREIQSVEVGARFHDVVVGYPTATTYMTGQFTDLYPSRARLTGQPYSSPVTMGATVTLRAHYRDGRTETKSAEIPTFQIGSFPTMVGSSRCHTANCTREALKEMGEDPLDPGGHFIAKHGEWIVDLLENIAYNKAHFHLRMKPSEQVRVEFLSQPGGAFENSSQICVRYATSGQITIEINSTKFEKVKLPFYLIYRLFGMTSDCDVVSTVVFDVDDKSPITLHMLDILERAFHLCDPAFEPLAKELNRERLVQLTAERVAKYLTNPTAYATNESAVQFLNEDLLGSPSKPGGLDRVLLPHMGQTAAARIKKLRFIGLLIHKMLLVHLRILPPTDRDSYCNKRVHGAGVSLAKAFKTQVNNTIIIQLFRGLKRELKNNAWDTITEKTIIDTVRNALTTTDLNRAMEQAITSGNKTIVVQRRAAQNRVSSQALERKNGLNTVSGLRTIVTQNAGNAAKQTERADAMRRVHPTYVGYICVAQSADTGENVGMRKQLAITAGVCSAGDALPLKLRLLADPAVTPLDAADSRDMLRKSLARVFVNGEWVGVCAEAHAIARRYRALRREGRAVDPYTSICHDPVTDEVEFWLDVGRLRRPLLIVDNNLEAYDAALRRRHAARRGGAALRGFVVRRGGEPEGLYYAESGAYVAFTKRLRELGHTAEGYTGNAPEALVAAGLAVAAEAPADVAELAKKAAAGGDAAEPKVEFVQNVRFTPEHARAVAEGRLTIADLVREGIAEYITPEEAANCLIAESIEVLRAARHDVAMRYTHCDVEQAIFGLAAHMSPFGNHTQPARVTYETNQGRQTGGWYVLNFPSRTDKNRFFQFYNEVPLVSTLTHSLVLPNGLNCMIAYASYGGDNQEDSAIVCQASADRGLFAGAFFRYELAELEKGETFAKPDPLATKNMKPDASYEKLVAGGFIAPGSVVHNGDVLIGRVAKLNRGRSEDRDRYQFTDRSVVYRGREPAFVEAVLKPRGANDELFGIVKLRFERPLRTGDKMCLTLDHEVLTRRGYVAIAEVGPDDEVACLDPATLDASWHRPTRAYAYDIEPTEDLYEVDAPGVKQCVTLEHRMFVRLGEGAPALVRARDLGGARDHYYLSGAPGEAREWHRVTSANIRVARGATRVACLEVPTGVFYVRRGGVASWTGNSSRSGNKSIVASMLPQSDMPFTEDGQTPDIIINTHSFPSRMTIGQLIETSLGNICARRGVIADGTAFLPVDHGQIAEEMHRLGFRYNGRRRMYNGQTGEFFDAAIFMCFTAEQRLQKFVLDDEQSVAGSGPTDATTGQPLGGKNVQGGLRFGEMEGWCIVGQGSMLNFHEKRYVDSDRRVMHICRGCGCYGAYNEYHGIYNCRNCGELADFAAVEGSKTAILFHEELAAANIEMRLGLRPREFDPKAD